VRSSPDDPANPAAALRATGGAVLDEMELACCWLQHEAPREVTLAPTQSPTPALTLTPTLTLTNPDPSPSPGPNPDPNPNQGAAAAALPTNPDPSPSPGPNPEPNPNQGAAAAALPSHSAALQDLRARAPPDGARTSPSYHP
jgi:hypothetical protein